MCRADIPLAVPFHSARFTFYIFEDLLFICDYVFLEGKGMKYNPLGPAGQTVTGGNRIREILKGGKLSTACDYNYVIKYDDWKRKFEAGPMFGGTFRILFVSSYQQRKTCAQQISPTSRSGGLQ